MYSFDYFDFIWVHSYHFLFSFQYSINNNNYNEYNIVQNLQFNIQYKFIQWYTMLFFQNLKFNIQCYTLFSKLKSHQLNWNWRFIVLIWCCFFKTFAIAYWIWCLVKFIFWFYNECYLSCTREVLTTYNLSQTWKTNKVRAR